MPEPFFITTAIDYTNAAPHIGHAYEKVLADVLARYRRLKGDEVFFLTGVDQHGQKVQQSAEKQGIPPQEFVDGVTAKFTALWEKLDVRYDAWAATTDQKHKGCVRAILQRLWDDRDPATGQSRWIYKKSQRGYYSIRQEQFLTDKERGPDGEFGPEWGQVEEREEENYYFRLTKHESLPIDPKQWLLDFIDGRSKAGRPFVVPDFRVAELRNAVEKLDGDLCITRPKARLSWGIEVPFDPNFVTFVWFDALVNYISFAGYNPQSLSVAAVYDRRTSPGGDGAEPAKVSDGRTPPLQAQDFLAFWPALHVIGKDILIPAHGVYWPIMLKALGFADEAMPTLLVHGWWNISGAKMSKSLGNVVDPDALADKYGAEALRYYLMSDIATGRDADFSEERLIGRYNTDLANALGNLLNRTLSMAGKYRGGQIVHTLEINDRLKDHVKNLAKVIREYREALGDSGLHSTPEPRVNDALGYVRVAGSYCDLLVESEAPWKLAKDPMQAARLDAVLYTLVESLRIIAILISPVLPRAAAAIFSQLNWNGPMALEETEWGKLPNEHLLGNPTPIFPRIEVPAADA